MAENMVWSENGIALKPDFNCTSVCAISKPSVSPCPMQRNHGSHRSRQIDYPWQNRLKKGHCGWKVPWDPWGLLDPCVLCFAEKLSRFGRQTALSLGFLDSFQMPLVKLKIHQQSERRFFTADSWKLGTQSSYWNLWRDPATFMSPWAPWSKSGRWDGKPPCS
jgi:hypothetical protein